VSTVQDQGFINDGEYIDLNGTEVNFAAGVSTAQVSVAIVDTPATTGSEVFRLIVQQNRRDPASTYLATDNFTIINIGALSPPPPPPPPSPPPGGGRFLIGPPAGFSSVTVGINDGTNPVFPAPVAGRFNVEVFTAAGVTTLPTLDGGFQAGIIDPAGKLIAPGYLTGTKLQLFTGNFLITDTVSGDAGQGPATIILGSGNQSVVGAPGDTIQGGSGSQVLDAIQQFAGGPETIIGGSGPTTVYGGPGDSVVAGSGNTYIDGTAGKMAIRVGSAGTDSIVGTVAVNTISGAAGGPDTISGGAALVQIQGLGKGDIVDFTNQTGSARINATAGNIAVTLGSGAAAVFGGVGDTINLGSVGQYADGGAGKLTIKLGTAGEDSVFGSSVASGGDTIVGGAGASLDFNPQVGGGGDLIDLSNSSGTAVINAFSAGSTQLTAVNDTIMAGTGSDSVWGGPGDRIGVGNSATAGGTHLFTHATTIPGASIGFGTNDAVFAATYGSTAGATTVNGVLAGASSARVSVDGFAENSGTPTDFIFYPGESSSTSSSIVATSTQVIANGAASTQFTLPDGTVMTLLGIPQADFNSSFFKP